MDFGFCSNADALNTILTSDNPAELSAAWIYLRTHDTMLSSGRARTASLQVQRAFLAYVEERGVDPQTSYYLAECSKLHTLDQQARHGQRVEARQAINGH